MGGPEEGGRTEGSPAQGGRAEGGQAEGVQQRGVQRRGVRRRGRFVWRRHPPQYTSFRGDCVIPRLGCGEYHDGRSNCSARRFLRKHPVRSGRKWTRSQLTTECRCVFLTNGKTNLQREPQLLGLECVEEPKGTLRIARYLSSFKHCVPQRSNCHNKVSF